MGGLKKYINYLADILLPLTACMLWLFEVWHLRYGFQSCVDEGWFLLGLNPQQELGVMATESFQILRFLLKLFPGTILDLRFMGLVFVFLGTWFLAVSSYLWLKSHQRQVLSKVVYFSIFLILGAIVYSGLLYTQTVHYNQLQTFLVLTMLALFFAIDISGKKTKIFSLILLGFFMFFSMINIPPSGLIVSLAIFKLLCIRDISRLRQIFLSVLYLAVGAVAGLLLYHVCIRPLGDVFHDFLRVTQIVQVEKSYSGDSFIVLVQRYLREFFYVSALSAVIILFFNRLGDQVKSFWLSAIVFVLLSLFCLMERRTGEGIIFIVPVIWAWLTTRQYKEVYPYGKVVLLALLMLLPLIMSIPFTSKVLLFYVPLVFVALFFAFRYREKIVHGNLYQISIVLLLLLLPLLASVGTNMGIQHKMIFFLPVWGVLFCGLLYRHALRETVWLKMFFLLTAIPFFAFTFLEKTPIHGSVLDSHTVTYLDNLHQVKLREEQKIHFEMFDSILRKHGYQPGDRIFALSADLGSVYAVGGLLHASLSDSYIIGRFMGSKTALKLAAPRFMILTEAEVHTLEPYFSGQAWNIQDDYLLYRIPPPDGEGDRFVYCRIDHGSD